MNLCHNLPQSIEQERDRLRCPEGRLSVRCLVRVRVGLEASESRERLLMFTAQLKLGPSQRLELQQTKPLHTLA